MVLMYINLKKLRSYTGIKEEELQEDPASGAAIGFSNEVRSTINDEFMDEEEY